MKVYIKFVLLITAIAATINTARSQSEQTNLEENLGTQLEDAYTTPFRNREFQGVVRYEKTKEGKDRTMMYPAFEFGPARNLQLTVAAPFYVGNADRTGSGNLRLKTLYTFNTESIYVPAFALGAAVDFPTGINAHGVDPFFKFIVTKSITRRLDRLHFNAEYKINSDPGIELMEGRNIPEREQRWKFIGGYSGRVGNTTLIVLDYVWEEERLENEISQLIELGFRKQVTPRLILSIGGAKGLTDQSPDFRVNFGLQQAF